VKDREFERLTPPKPLHHEYINHQMLAAQQTCLGLLTETQTYPKRKFFEWPAWLAILSII